MNAVRQLVAAHAAGTAHRCFLADARSERSLDFAMLRTLPRSGASSSTPPDYHRTPGYWSTLRIRLLSAPCISL